MPQNMAQRPQHPSLFGHSSELVTIVALVVCKLQIPQDQKYKKADDTSPSIAEALIQKFLRIGPFCHSYSRYETGAGYYLELVPGQWTWCITSYHS
ncbi:hypothetical protein M0R45_029460 [Rubus argutus]|uniref:Uncharacterized protein n=1 Tax=Rubus argutus TaxID=59490 RepID=A0AAW1WAT8_RUBAR